MNIIKNLRDLDRLVATSAFCHEPPASERRAIHESGAWRWVPKYTGRMDAAELSSAILSEIPMGHWEPAPFSSDPAASYALEAELQKTRQVMMWWSEGDWCVDAAPEDYRGPILREETAIHQSRLIGLCLVSLRALGVEFTLAEGWDK